MQRRRRGMKRGLFIVLEGIDGSGTTSLPLMIRRRELPVRSRPRGMPPAASMSRSSFTRC